MRPEPSHAGIEAAFCAALIQPAGPQAAPPEGLCAPAPDEIARRFAVYRNNHRHSLTRALAGRFAVIEALLGPDFFAAMAPLFIAASPPRRQVLQEWGAAFPAFLEGFAPVAHLQWLGDVARLEWLRGRAVHAADAAPLPGAVLARPDPGALRLGLHPSVALWRSEHPALSIWQAHQPGAARTPLPPGPEQALIGRQPDFAVVVLPVDAESHAVLAALAGGAPLGQAARLADPTAALTLLLRHGLITHAVTGDPA